MKRVAITAMVCESEGNLCYHCANAPTPMTDPKNTEDQELSRDQLKDAAGGAAFIKIGDIKGEYRQVILPEFRDRIAGSAGRGGDDV